MEAGAERYRLGDMEVSSLVSRVAADLAPQAQASGHRLDMSAPGGVAHVRADEHALATAVRNLIDNALKYSPPGSSVSVEVRRQDDRVLIAVGDEGPGIPRAEQRAIFKKFVRGRSAVDANVKGTGVGLSMVRRIVDAHGGEIRLDSDAGRGSTFTIALPVQAEPLAPSPRPEALRL